MNEGAAKDSVGATVVHVSEKSTRRGSGQQQARDPAGPLGLSNLQARIPMCYLGLPSEFFQKRC